MKELNGIYNTLKQEQDLKVILNSLRDALIKFKRTEIELDQNHLIFKIIDNCGVSQAKARTYINLLESRNFIQFKGTNIVYKQKDEKTTTETQCSL